MNQLLASTIARQVALVTSLALVGGGLGACTTIDPETAVMEIYLTE